MSKKLNSYRGLNLKLKPPIDRGFFGRSSMPRLKWKGDWKTFNISLFEGTKFNVWIYISKFRGNPLDFSLVIKGVISLSTTYLGKRVCGRLNLTRLFSKDFHVYTNDDNMSSNNYS